MLTLSELQLRALVDNNGVQLVELIPAGAKWSVQFNGRYLLYSARNKPRLFALADSALVYLKKMGLCRVSIDLSRWTPAPKGFQ